VVTRLPYQFQTSRPISILVILGRKCTLAASRACPGESSWVCAAPY